MRFDWYQATIEDKPHAVLDQVKKLGHEVRVADGAARRWRYRQGWEVLHRDKGSVALVMAGGNGDKPHALATSEAAEAFAALVRDVWPDRHLVTRVDAAQDFYEVGAFDRLRKECRKVAKQHRLAFPKVEDELDPTAGRTQYMGSPKSDYRVRLYEKGWEQAGHLRAQFRRQGFEMTQEQIKTLAIRNEATGEYVDPSIWIREEAQIRPKQEEARRLVAGLTPEQCWGCSPWMQELARTTMALDLERIVMRTHKISKDEEALRWMCKQYGGMLSRLHGDLGDWPCVGLEIGRILGEMAKQ